MKTALVFPPFFLQSLYNLPPLGLINLGTALREAGHEAALVDLVLAIRVKGLSLGPSIYEDAARLILMEDPGMAAFSAQCATMPGIIRIASILKEKRPAIRIVLGGHDVSFTDERLLERFTCVDAIVRGEGETAFLQLATAYARGGDETGIDGVTWRREGKVTRNRDRELIADLDSLPLPDYSLAPELETYRRACGLPRAIAILEAGRGCPHRCVYCSESVMWRQRSRTFSVERLVREMRLLRDDHGAQRFLLAYDQFTTDRAYVERFCHGVLEAGLNTTPWYCISRLDSVDRPLLRLMREAGCESMCYGIDSGSEKTLAFIGKDIDEGILHQRVRETTEEGMTPTLSFVVGFPEEEREDLDKTLLLALRAGVQGNSNPLIQMPTVLPGTELHRRYSGRLARSADTYFSLGLEFDNGRRLKEDIRLIESDPFIFSAFHNLPCAGAPAAELENITASFPLIVNLFPRSFLLLAARLRASVSGLFSDFLRFVARMEKREGHLLTPDDCRRHMPGFVPMRLGAAPESRSSHLPEMVFYESTLMEAAGASNGLPRPTPSVPDWEECPPMWNPSAIVREFRYNLPAITGDMREGLFCERYGEERTILVFVPRDKGVDVTEINEFGLYLMQLSDGSSSTEEITRELYSRFGAGTDPEVFRSQCREAISALGEMALLQPAVPFPDSRKEVITC